MYIHTYSLNEVRLLGVTTSPARATAYPTKTPVLGVGQLPLKSWSRRSRRPSTPQTILTLPLAASQNLKVGPIVEDTTSLGHRIGIRRTGTNLEASGRCYASCQVTQLCNL